PREVHAVRDGVGADGEGLPVVVAGEVGREREKCPRLDGVATGSRLRGAAARRARHRGCDDEGLREFRRGAHGYGPSVKPGKPSSFAAAFIWSTTDPARLGSTASCTAV